MCICLCVVLSSQSSGRDLLCICLCVLFCRLCPVVEICYVYMFVCCFLISVQW